MSHSDFDHKMSADFAAMFTTTPKTAEAPIDTLAELAALTARAERMTERKENLITAGAAGEPCLAEAREEGVMLRKLPNDPPCVRISLGRTRFEMPQEGTYCVYRGARDEVIALLESALSAIRTSSMP